MEEVSVVVMSTLSSTTSTSTTATFTISTKTTTKKVSTGSSPRIRPRPVYPSFWIIAGHFLHLYVFHQGIVGTLLVKYGAPVYLWTRQWALEKEIDDAMYFAVVVSALHTGLYLGINLPFFLCDQYQLFQADKLYRKPFMQSKSNELLLPLGSSQLLSQLLITPFVVYFGYPFFFQKILLDLDATLPSFGESFRVIMICCMANDLLFYVFHRLLHSKWLYGPIHKQHHEFVGSVGYAAEYCHPLEGLFSNQLPVVVGAVLTHCHPFVFLMYLAVRLQETYECHSGYLCGSHSHNPVVKTWSWFWGKHYQTAFHDFHHTHNTGNFGACWVDWLFGTMDHYQAMDGYEGYLALKDKRDGVE